MSFGLDAGADDDDVAGVGCGRGAPLLVVPLLGLLAPGAPADRLAVRWFAAWRSCDGLPLGLAEGVALGLEDGVAGEVTGVVVVADA